MSQPGMIFASIHEITTQEYEKTLQANTHGNSDISKCMLPCSYNFYTPCSTCVSERGTDTPPSSLLQLARKRSTRQTGVGRAQITSHLNSRAISCVWKPFPHVAIGPLCGHHDGHLAYIITTNMLTHRQWCSTALCLLREVRPHEQIAVLCDHETASDDAAM